MCVCVAPLRVHTNVCHVQEAAAMASRSRYEQLQNRHEMYVREQLDNRDRLSVEHGRLAQVGSPAVAEGDCSVAFLALTSVYPVQP